MTNHLQICSIRSRLRIVLEEYQDFEISKFRDLRLWDRRLPRKPRLDAGRIRRVKGARPRVVAREGTVNYRTTSGRDGI